MHESYEIGHGLCRTWIVDGKLNLIVHSVNATCVCMVHILLIVSVKCTCLLGGKWNFEQKLLQLKKKMLKVI